MALAQQFEKRLAALEFDVRYGATPPEEGSSGGSFWIVCPETLVDGAGVRTASFFCLQRWRPDLIVIDECHAVYEWGRDFRPSYAAVPDLVRDLPATQTLWLSATLTSRMLRDLAACLTPTPEIVDHFALAEQLSIHVSHVPYRLRDQFLRSWRKTQREPGVVFASTRKHAEHLQSLVEPTLTFHAGFGREEKVGKLLHLVSHPQHSVAATSAFGMGLDFPWFRWALLVEPPPSLLSLAQWTGRVARQGSGRAWIWYDENDAARMAWLTRRSSYHHGEFEKVLEFLQTRRCRRQMLTTYFRGEQERSDRNCQQCDYCLGSGSGTLKTAVSL